MQEYSGRNSQPKRLLNHWGAREPIRHWNPKPILLVAWGRDNEGHKELVMKAYDDLMKDDCHVACLDLLEHMDRDPAKT